MKLFKKVIAGFGALSVLLCVATAANAAQWDNDPVYNGVACKVRNGGTYPEDGHVVYCGTDTVKRDAILLTLTTTFNSYPLIKTKMASRPVTFFVFTDVIQMATYQALSPPTDPQKKLVYDQYPDVAGVSLNGSLAVPAVPYSSVVFEKKAHGTYPNLVNLSTGESQHGILHEVGHQFDYQAAAAPDKSINEDFVSLGRADQNYMTANAIGPTAAQLRSTHGYFIVASPPKFPEWTEIFAEQVAKLTNEANPSIGTPFTVDTEALSPYFKCTQVYTKAAITTGTAPTKANFDAVSASLYARCVAPYAPVACARVESSGSYPYRFNGLEPTIGWYVYCGNNPTRFSTRTGNNFQSLPTSIPPEWRPKFQAAGWGLYVFRDAAQAVSLLGSAAVPASAQVAGVLGFTQPLILGNAKTPFVAMFEQVKQSNGTYVEHPNTNDLFNYDSGLWRESGRVIDKLAGANGSVNATFRSAVTGDIAHFNGRNGCAASGADANLWGSLKSTICNTTTGVKKAPYVGVANIAIVRGFTLAQLGGSAVAFPPDYAAFFIDAPTTPNYSLIWAELIGAKRAGGNRGNNFAQLDYWLATIYTCSKVYSDYYYTNGVPPSATCVA